jgi:hypothetical protein
MVCIVTGECSVFNLTSSCDIDVDSRSSRE